MNRQLRRARWTSGAALLGAASMVAAGMTTAPVSADDAAPTARQAARAAKGTVRGVYHHLFRLEEIADANDGNRASGLPGYRASKNYVVRQLRRSATTRWCSPSSSPSSSRPGRPRSRSTAPRCVEDEDYAVMTYSGNGEATGDITGVDLQLTTPNSSDSGCSTDGTTGEPEDDFVDFPAGDIALLQRGTCAFGEKVLNAQAAGAAGGDRDEPGQHPGADRQDLFIGTLGDARRHPRDRRQLPDR